MSAGLSILVLATSLHHLGGGHVLGFSPELGPCAPKCAQYRAAHALLCTSLFHQHACKEFSCVNMIDIAYTDTVVSCIVTCADRLRSVRSLCGKPQCCSKSTDVGEQGAQPC